MNHARNSTTAYRRFIAGPTLNNSQKKEVEIYWKLSLDVVEIFFKNGFFWILSLNVVENVAKVDFFFFSFFSQMQFSHFNSTNMC